MTTALTALGDLLAEFGQSDVGGHVSTLLNVWIANSAAHAGIGAFVALAGWQRLALALAVLWIGKELAFDLPGDGFALLTWGDSAADLGFAAQGWWWARAQCGRQSDVTTAPDQCLDPAMAPKNRKHHARPRS